MSGIYYYSRKIFLFYEPQELISVTKMSYWTYLQETQSSLYFQTIFIQVKFQYSCPLYAYGSQVALSPSDSINRNCDRIPSRDVKFFNFKISISSSPQKCTVVMPTDSTKVQYNFKDYFKAVFPPII